MSNAKKKSKLFKKNAQKSHKSLLMFNLAQFKQN
jgi:hypothetical protein